MTTDIDTVRAQCVEWEKTLAANGWHIGLTGSVLYGETRSDDVDLIIYPHIEDDGNTSQLAPEQVLLLLGVTDITHDVRDYPGAVHYIYCDRFCGTNIDAFFLK